MEEHQEMSPILTENSQLVSFIDGSIDTLSKNIDPDESTKIFQKILTTISN